MKQQSKFTRREFVKRAALVGAAASLPWKFGTASAYAVGANSGNLKKWVQPLRGLVALGDANGIPSPAATDDPVLKDTQLVQLTAGEFTDQLHPDLPPTTLWGYYDSTAPVKRHLGGLIVAERGTGVRIRMTNKLPALHIIPVDSTVMPGPLQAQNRIAIHLHGGAMPWICDGGPFDWYDPDGNHGMSFYNGPGGVLDNIPAGTGPGQMVPGQADYWYPNDQSARLAWYHDHAWGITRINAYAGLASGYLILDAIHDNYTDGDRLHGVPDTSKIPGLLSTAPLVFQDKVFVSATTALTDPTWATVARPDLRNAVGSLFYEHVYDPRQYKLLKGGAYMPPPDPSIIPEFFGDTMLCNGTVYPYLEVEAKRYRFLLLNACNARFLNINVFQANPRNVDGIDLNTRTLFPLNPPGPNMIQIANEAGYLLQEVAFVSPKPFNPVTLTGNLLLAPAERAEIIMDFTGQAGKEFILYNDAPGPFPVGPAANDYFLGNPNNPIQPITIRDKATGQKWSTGPDTRQLLRIKVVAAKTQDRQPTGPILEREDVDTVSLLNYPSTIAAPMPPIPVKGSIPAPRIRDLTLNEDFDQWGRLRQRLGTTNPNALGGFGLDYLEPATENVNYGEVQIWRIFNNTADTHPIHFHLVNVQVMSRQPFVISKGVFSPVGAERGPELNELGWKETVQMHPGEMTSVVMRFDRAPVPALKAGRSVTIPTSARTGGDEYVWHCHILEHEEHDMMRPLVVS